MQSGHKVGIEVSPCRNHKEVVGTLTCSTEPRACAVDSDLLGLRKGGSRHCENPSAEGGGDSRLTKTPPTTMEASSCCLTPRAGFFRGPGHSCKWAFRGVCIRPRWPLGA